MQLLTLPAKRAETEEACETERDVQASVALALYSLRLTGSGEFQHACSSARNPAVP